MYFSAALSHCNFLVTHRRPPSPTLFPYTTLFRSELARRDLIDVVLAYRKSGKCKADPVCRSEEVCEKEQVCSRGLGASYQSAIDVFNWIRNHTPCDVYAFDVKGFFDTLDHQQVKEKRSEERRVGKECRS